LEVGFDVTNSLKYGPDDFKIAWSKGTYLLAVTRNVAAVRFI